MISQISTLTNQGDEVKAQRQQEEDTNEITQQKIEEVQQENAQMYTETKKLREESKNKKKENAKILT